MKTGIIIQARTGSSRLARKMVLPFYEGKGILETILVRLNQAHLGVSIVVATTEKETDDIICEIAVRCGVDFFRGNEMDVLSRFINAAEKYEIEKIIRICADNPFLDLYSLKNLIYNFDDSNYDYMSFCKANGTPTIRTHYGFYAEGVNLKALKKIESLTDDQLYREHVTNFIYSTAEHFNIHFETIDEEVEKAENIRLTIDTLSDFSLAQTIYHKMKKNKIPFHPNNIVRYIGDNAQWLNLMKNEIARNTK